MQFFINFLFVRLLLFSATAQELSDQENFFNFMGLPCELQVHALSFLPYADLQQTRLVSQRIKKLAEDVITDKLTKSPNFKIDPTHTLAAYQPVLVPERLTRLTFFNATINEDDFDYLCEANLNQLKFYNSNIDLGRDNIGKKACPLLETLMMRSGSLEMSYQKILSAFPNLYYLELDSVKLPADFSQHLPCLGKLRTLKISNAQVDLLAIHRAAPMLEEIELIWCTITNYDQFIQSTPTSLFPNATNNITIIKCTNLCV